MKIHRYTLHPNPRVSIICGFTQDRFHMLDRARTEMEGQMTGQPVEFVSVEWEASDGEWREGVAKNFGAFNAPVCRYIFTNCDITIPRELVEIVLKNNPDEPWYISGLRYDEDEQFGLTENPHALGDFQAVSHPAFVKIEVFNERMSGWGYCDIDFHNRLCQAVPSIQLTGLRVRHNWHPRTMTDQQYRESNQRNKALV